jgi:elongation factor G
VPPVTGHETTGKGVSKTDAAAAEEAEGAPIERHADDSEPFAALAFKVMADPYVGKLTYFRVYSGTLRAGSRVLNVSNGRTERIGRLLMLHANHREEIEECYAGDICAGVG